MCSLHHEAGGNEFDRPARVALSAVFDDLNRALHCAYVGANGCSNHLPPSPFRDAGANAFTKGYSGEGI